MARPRKEEKTVSLHARVKPGTPDKLKALAILLGLTHGGEGSTGKLLDKVADLVTEETLGLLVDKNKGDG